MRPVIPALAALAWGEPRRRAYWEQELLNALVIIERGWSTPQEMRGSWAGAMGHTHGCRRCGSIPASTMTATAGCRRSASLTTRSPAPRNIWSSAASTAAASTGATRSAGRRQDRRRRLANLRGWQKAGDPRRRQAVPAAGREREAVAAGAGRACVPARPELLCGALYNPSMNYTMSIVHLGDRVMGGGPFVQPFPGGERTPTWPRCRKSRSSDRARLRYRRHRRPGRQRHHARGAQFPAQSRDAAGRRLCRGEAARAVASGPVIRFYGPSRNPRIIP